MLFLFIGITGNIFAISNVVIDTNFHINTLGEMTVQVAESRLHETTFTETCCMKSNDITCP